MPPCPARDDLTSVAMDSPGSGVVRHDRCHSGMMDIARDDTASIAMDPDTDELRLEQGQAGLLGSTSDNAVCTAIEPENTDETRPDQDQSAASSRACGSTMNIVMETARR